MRLETVLSNNGHKAQLMVGDGKPLTQSEIEIRNAAASVHVVLLGMSTSAELARPEIVAGEAAREAHVPYGFYGDIPECWRRASQGTWFADLAQQASFYFGTTQADADLSRSVFPKASLFGTGNPLREDMALPRYTREEIRLMFGVRDDEILILAPGDKFPAATMAAWTMIMQALHDITIQENQPSRFRLFLTTHPGDRSLDAISQRSGARINLYEELVQHSPVPTQLITSSEINTTDLVPGANLIIEFGSSSSIDGAYNQIPVITLAFETRLNRLAFMNGGSRTLECVSQGLSQLIEGDSAELRTAILDLLTPEKVACIQILQRKLYPKPTKCGVSLEKMLQALVKIYDEYISPPMC
jgi:hypothetical protein